MGRYYCNAHDREYNSECPNCVAEETRDAIRKLAEDDDDDDDYVYVSPSYGKPDPTPEPRTSYAEDHPVAFFFFAVLAIGCMVGSSFCDAHNIHSITDLQKYLATLF